ncbi:MAG: hypothetical protein L0211_11405 [Planctomycetaceae bacterium]|nr:hypothetical protein [Planctomycetaceae bacterium]
MSPEIPDDAQLPDDLDLAAFRYVAGEMSPDEAIAFEARLADDQPARESVGRAVALAERLAEAAPAEEPIVERRADYRWVIAPLGWMAAGAAVALLAVSLLGRSGGSAIQPPDAGNPGTVGPGEGRANPDVDALVWARLQAGPQWAAADLERWLDEPAEVTAEDEADWSDPPEVPAWIFTTSQNSKRGQP